jgi:2-polyprenyl-6-methoxyphenol hydroxylase-like FAD-dependent oxidoreductase
VLLGDAAHSGTANGLGTAWGLVGAYILAGELGTKLLASQGAGSGLSTAEIAQAARNYEDKWRPVATGSHGMSESGMGALFRQRSKLGIWLLHTMARLVSHLKLDPTEGIDEFAAKWVMPEYPALEGVAEG